MPFEHLSGEQLHAVLNRDSETATSDSQALLKEQLTLIDIRDPQSYQAGHIEGAIHIDNGNVDDFLARADKSKALVVCCYHGNSSQSAADFFNQQGFVKAYSLDGGYEHYKGL